MGITSLSQAGAEIPPGLRLITPTSIANSGGSSSASGGEVTFTGVSSISLNGVFTSGYDYYRIMADIGTSTTAWISMRIRVSGSDNTSSVYTQQFMVSYTSTVTAAQSLSASSWPNILYPATANPAIFAMDLSNPAVAAYTSGVWDAQRGDGTVSTQNGALAHASASGYDGFTLTVASGTITGTVRVYGYQNA